MSDVVGSSPESRALGSTTIFALLVALLAAGAQVAGSVRTIHSVASMFVDLGGALPIPTRLLVSLNNGKLLAPVLLVVDGLAFAWLYRLSRANSPQLLFLLPIVYLGLAGVLRFVAYMPLHHVISLIK